MNGPFVERWLALTGVCLALGGLPAQAGGAVQAGEPTGTARAVPVPSVGDTVRLADLPAGRQGPMPAPARIRPTRPPPGPGVSRPSARRDAEARTAAPVRRLRLPTADAPTRPTVSEWLAPAQAPSPADPPSPAASASFLAAMDTGAPNSFSPDTGGAVGHTHQMVALTTGLTIQDRAGAVLTNLPLAVFWAGVTTPNPAVYEPRLTYDPFQQRWIFVAVANFTNHPGLLIAVSQSGDPTLGWHRRFIAADANRPVYAATPTVGFSDSRIVVQANMFYKTNSGFFGSYIYAFTKADLYAGGSGSPRRIEFLAYNAADPIFSQGVEENAPVPAVTYDGGVAPNYFVGNLNGNDTGAGFIRIYSLSGPLGAETFQIATVSDPVVFPAWEHYAASFAFLPQAGTTNRIDAGDCRMQNVVMQNAQLWAVQTVFYPVETPRYSAIQWWALTPGGTITQSGTIEDPHATNHYAYASIAVNDINEVLVGYTRFSYWDYPSAYYALQGANDPGDYLRPPTLLKAGEAPYEKKSASGIIYWGGWSAAALDPNNLIDLWTVQQYAATPVGGTNRWGTWWGRVSPPVNLVLTMQSSVGQAIQQSNLTYTFTVTNANYGLPASGVRLTNTLPAGVTFVSASSSQGNCSYADGRVGCRIGQLGVAAVATVSVTVLPNVVGQIVNSAFVVANGPDDVPANNTASLTTQVLPSVDLAVLGAVTPNPVTSGHNVAWTLTVSNIGLSPASAVTLSNTLPAGMTFLSVNTSQGSCSPSGNVIACSLGVIASQAAATVTLTARSGSGGVTVTNVATVRTASVDVDSVNNTARTSLRVNAYPTLGGIAHQSVNEDPGPVVLAFTVSDPETPSGSLGLTASSSTPALLPNANVVLGGSGANRTLTLTPLPDQHGVATITRILTDGGGASVTNTFQFTVNPVNDPPTVDSIAHLSVDEDASSTSVPITGLGSGAANETQTLTVTASSSDTGIIPTPTVTYGGGSSGSLSFAPALNAFGSVTLTVRVNDGGADNNLTLRTFTVTVRPVNDPPRLAALSDLVLDEDAGQQTVNLSGITSGAFNETDTLTLSVSNSNPALLTGFNLGYTSPANTGTLTFGTVSNAFGTAVVTLTVNDNRGSNNLTTRAFTVTVNSVNDRPTLDPIASLTLEEDAPPQTVPLTGLSFGPANENQTLTVTVTNLNPALVTNVVLNYASPDPAGVLNFSLVPQASGTATLWVAANDGDTVNNIRNRSFTITVNPVNDPPTIDPLPHLTLEEDAGLQTIILTGISPGAPDEIQTVNITATSSNTALIPNPTVAYTSPSNWAVLTFTPVPNGFGTATLNVRLGDGGTSNNVTRVSFDVTVAAVNDPPTLNPIANLTTNENAGQLSVPLTGITTGAPNETDPLSFSVSTSRPDLLTNFAVNHTSPSASGTLSFRTVANGFGTALVNVTLNDGASSNNLIVRTFTVEVVEINDPPTLNPLADVSMDEDGDPLVVTLSGITSGAANEPQTLVVSASSGNPALVPNPIPVSYSTPATSGSLTLAPRPDAFGTTLITVTVNDGGASNNVMVRTFTLTVRSVNDLPVISFIDPQVTAEDVPLQVAFTIGDKETAAGNLTLLGESFNEELVMAADIRFSGSGANRTVLILPLTNQVGVATLALTVTDADGGSSTAFVELEVTPVNDPPYLSQIPAQTINRDTATAPLPFTVEDVDSLLQSVTLSARSSNPALVPEANITLSGTGRDRTVRVTPVPGGVGSVTITLVATDGLATNSSSFALVVNGPPTISAVASRSIAEDTSTGAIPFTVGDAETPLAGLGVTARSSNTNLVAPAGLGLGGSGSSRTLTVTPQPNQFGETVITLTVTDTQGLSTSNSFTLTVTSVNDVPTISGFTSQTVAENGVLGPLAFTIGDVETAAAQLLLSATSSDPRLVPDAAVTFGGSGANRTLTLRPAPGRNGSTTVTVFVADLEGGATNASFMVTVTAVNDAPTLTPPPNVAMNEDSTSGPLPFVVGDPDTPAGSLTVTASSSNPSLVPNANLVLGGSGTDRTITATPAANQFGTASITLTVNDGSGGSTNASFTLTVHAVNDPPTLDALSHRTIGEDAGLQTVSLSGISSGAANESQALTVSAISSLPAVVPHPTVNYSSPNATGSLTFTPVANAFGQATITVTLNDNATSNNLVVRTFTVTVTPANDAPTISDMANQSAAEGASLTVPFTIGDLETPVHALALSATSSNVALVPNNRLNFEGAGATRSLVIVPNPDLSGTSLITVTVSDGTNSASDSFLLTVTSVNNPPTLNPILDMGVVANANTTLALGGISSGAANESQTLTLTVSNNNAAFFGTLPAISYTSPNTTANLTFKAADKKFGSAVVTVTVRDNGSPNQSFSRSFTIYSRLSGNAAPTISAIPTQTIQEGANAGPIAFTIGDSVTPAALLTVSALSSNFTLVPSNGFTFGGSGASRTVTITPAPYQFGTNLITIGVLDTNFGYNRTNFLLVINPVNNPPQISSIASVNLAEDTASGVIPFTVSDAETRATALTVTASSSNPALVPPANVILGGSGTNRALVVVPAPDQSGTAVITLVVNDGANTNATAFTVNVSAVNDPPTLAGPADVLMNEDATAGPFPVTVADAETLAASLTLSATSSNPGLLPAAGVTFGGTGSSRTVSFTPVANQFGTALVTLIVTDAAGASASNVVNATILPVNDPPTLGPLNNLAINQNAALQTVSLTGIGSGAANEAQALYVTASSSDPAIIPTPAVSYTSPNTTGTLTFRPNTNASGSATITVTVSDGQPVNSTATRAFTVTVNGAPTLTAIPPQTTLEDTPTAALAVVVSDDLTALGSLTLSGASSDQALVPNANIVFGGSGANRTVTLTPALNQFGLATITVTATDAGGASARRSFALRVNPVNDPPTLASINNLTMAEDSGLQTVNLSGISSGAANESQALTITAVSSLPGLIPHPTVNYSSPATTGTLTFTPVADQSGVATITVTVNDGQSTNHTTTRSFTVTVTAVNDPPTLAAINNMVVNEDSGLHTVALTGITSGAANENQALTVSALSSNPALIPHPTVTYATPSATGSLAFTPLPNAFGAATITVTVSDGQAVNPTFSRMFTVTVSAVNDSPTLDPIGDVVATAGGGPRAVPLTGITSGATNENQLLTFTAVSSNLTLIPNPTITYTSPNTSGTLHFTPSAGATGTVTLRVTLNDGAPSNNLVVRTFNVTVTVEARLRVALEPDGRVALFWPAALAGFVPQSKTALDSGAVWLPVPGTPQQVQGEFKLVVAAEGRHRFFRLQSP